MPDGGGRQWTRELGRGGTPQPGPRSLNRCRAAAAPAGAGKMPPAQEVRVEMGGGGGGWGGGGQMMMLLLVLLKATSQRVGSL